MKRTLLAVGLLLVGIVVGVVVTILFGLILVGSEDGTPLIRPRTFGDTKISLLDSLVSGDHDTRKTLVMTRDDVNFLVMTQNEFGKVDGLLLLNDKDEAILSIRPLGELGKWGKVKYGKTNRSGNRVGDVFEDINFDGLFDVKHVMDGFGQHLSAFIFVGGSWQIVDYLNVDDMTAASGQTNYEFDPNSGWRK